MNFLKIRFLFKENKLDLHTLVLEAQFRFYYWCLLELVIRLVHSERRSWDHQKWWRNFFTGSDECWRKKNRELNAEFKIDFTIYFCWSLSNKMSSLFARIIRICSSRDLSCWSSCSTCAFSSFTFSTSAGVLLLGPSPLYSFPIIRLARLTHIHRQ